MDSGRLSGPVEKGAASMTQCTALSDPRFPPGFVLAASVAILGAAFAFQYIGGLVPCVLCIYQRWPYAVTIALSLTALALARQGEGQIAARGILYLCGLVFLVGAAIAVFHVGVEQHWWEGTPECGVLSGGGTLEQLTESLKHGPVVRCDQPQWTLLGISMAGYNAVLSVLLAVFCALAPRLKR
jgi:disulfide bond formation protein DsbB